MNEFAQIWFGDILVNGLAVAGVGVLAFLAWEMVREMRRKRRQQRIKDRTERKAPNS